MRLSIHSSSSTAFPSLKVARVAEANPLKFIVFFSLNFVVSISIRGSDTSEFIKKIKNISDPASRSWRSCRFPLYRYQSSSDSPRLFNAMNPAQWRTCLISGYRGWVEGWVELVYVYRSPRTLGDWIGGRNGSKTQFSLVSDSYKLKSGERMEFPITTTNNHLRSPTE